MCIGLIKEYENENQLDKIDLNGGMHLTPVHATSGVLGLVHAHA